MPTSAPFFSNDLPGLIKILATFGTMLGVLIAVVVRLSQSRYAKEQETQEARITDLAKDLDNLGGKLNDVNTECTRRATDHAALANRVSAIEIEGHGIQRQLGELREGVGGLRTQNNQLMQDITTLIIESAKHTNDSVHAIALDVRGLQERDRLAVMLEQLLKKVGS